MLPLFHDILCVHQLFRYMGFPPEDIFIHLNGERDVIVLLRTQDKLFSFTVGPAEMSHEEFARRWHEVVNLFNRGFEDIDFVHSDVAAQGVMVLDAVEAKGIVIPNGPRVREMLSLLARPFPRLDPANLN